ncbi:MAG TPA: hypothetical protein VNX68_07630 [Nitrosopumilaceae archaeon]|jgi:hypothetical protein|nr:hypothetical protein [Nitrosopumilaceae archaeon]
MKKPLKKNPKYTFVYLIYRLSNIKKGCDMIKGKRKGDWRRIEKSFDPLKQVGIDADNEIEAMRGVYSRYPKSAYGIVLEYKDKIG